jgi:hypothetical protein
MTNQERLAMIAELKEARQRGRRITPTQINQIKALGQSLADSQADLYEIQYNIRTQLFTLQRTCPHPFRYVLWKEQIPMGHVKGVCELCGDDNRWFHTYSKKQRDTVKFRIRKASANG